MRSLKFVGLIFAVFVIPVAATSSGLDTGRIDQALGRSGKQIGDVYRVSFPRSDLHVTLQGVTLLPEFALASRAAFTGTDAHATVVGNLVLLPEEVNPVMERLRTMGFEITALDDPLLFEVPRLMDLHFSGQGDSLNLAKRLRSALEASATPLAPALTVPEPATEPEWARAILKVLRRKGTFSGGVLAINVPRFDEITQDVTEIPPAMGVEEAFRFELSGNGHVAATGNFVLTENEVNPVISALEAHHILVTALHNPMLDEEPRLFLMHFWTEGSPKTVAQGLRAALALVRAE